MPPGTAIVSGQRSSHGNAEINIRVVNISDAIGGAFLCILKNKQPHPLRKAKTDSEWSRFKGKILAKKDEYKEKRRRLLKKALILLASRGFCTLGIVEMNPTNPRV